MTVERVDTPDDPRLAPYRDLRSSDTVRRKGLFVAETRDIVRQLLASRRFGVHSVLLTDTAREALGDALDARARFPIYVAPLPVLKAVGGFDLHAGFLQLGR